MISRIRLWTTIAIAGAAICMTPAARADVFDFSLMIGNTSGSPSLAGFSGPFADVSVSRTSSTSATVTFTSDTSTSGNADCTTTDPCTYLLGGQGAVALNINGAFSLVTPVTPQPPFTLDGATFDPTGAPTNSYSAGGTASEDGFGKFNFTLDSFDGFFDSATSISFTLNATGSTTWGSAQDVLTPNASGYSAAAHIFVESALCTDTSGACTTGYAVDAPVPEPASIAFFGTGLLAAGFALRRKFKVNR